MRMTISKSKAATIAVSVFLMIAMAASLVALPANAQTAKKTYAFIGATPNPVGVGQEVLLHVGISQQLGITWQSWTDLTVTVTRPDGTTETLGPFKTDATGGTGTSYVPTMEGTYKLQTHFPAQSLDVIDFFGNVVGTQDYAASDSDIISLIVQAEPIAYFPGFPLPTEYWVRPINAQFYEWAPVAGNWLRPAGSYTMPPIPKYHPYNEDAPETAHILWTKQYAPGGLTGGDLGNVQYEMGDAYVGKFLGSVIIDGVLYYNQFQETGATAVEQNVVAVNLKTGEELWVRNWDNKRLAFGQVYFFDSFNYHGAFAYLWTETAVRNEYGQTVSYIWDAYDALTGRWLYTLTDVPPGYNLYGPKGEIYRYTVNTANGWLAQWNSSRAINPQNTGSVGDGSWTPIGSTINATRGYDWNVSIPAGLPGAVCHYALDDCILGSQSSAFPSYTGPTITSWAISTKKDSAGQLIFNKTWTVPAELADATWVWSDVSFEDRVFVISCKESLRFYGLDLDTGNYMWQTDKEPYLQYYDKWYGPCYGYGNFYSERMSGMIISYDMQTGERKWTYNVTDKYAEILWSENFPTEFHFLADGKIYLSYGEHSPIDPTGRGAPMVCLNATSGEEIWTLSWFNNWWGGHVIIGDSIMAGLNAYDGRVYSIGKGPSATTVSIQKDITTFGDNVLVKGTVTDVSPGTEEYALTARFPNGVPAVSDDNMTAWMEYVYMQYPSPTDVDGVEVTISVFDPNGNVYDVGTATSDASGSFCCEFTPEVPGLYTVYATFAGSKAYWSSSAQTYLKVNEAPQATPPPTPTPAPMTDTYVLGLGAGAIVAIVVIGLVLILMLRKR
jgi:hypothetical protein